MPAADDRPATVTCVGIATLDRVYRVAVLATAPGKYRATERAEVGGGVAANAAVTVARLGGRARFIGAVGDDLTGVAIRDGLVAEGVDVAGLATAPGARSPESVVQVDDDGERLVVNHASPDLFDRVSPPSPTLLADSDVVLADMRWPAGAIAALRAARADGRPAVVDCDHDPTDAPGILEEASHVVFAAATLRRYVGLDHLDAAVKRAAIDLDAWVAATDGAAGTWWSDGHDTGRVPAVTVEAVDTLGAGDVFHGAFALAVAEGSAPVEALGWASGVAALKCTRFGGRAGIPDRGEVADFLGERA